MLQYTFTVPDTTPARKLLDYILISNVFEVKEYKTDKKEIQKKMLKDDLIDAFTEIDQMRKGKTEKKNLKQFLNEF